MGPEVLQLKGELLKKITNVILGTKVNMCSEKRK